MYTFYISFPQLLLCMFVFHVFRKIVDYLFSLIDRRIR